MAGLYLVDTDDEFRNRVALYLRLLGFSVLEFISPKEVFFTARDHQPECLISELAFPDDDGFRFIRNLKIEYSRPVVVLSERNSESDHGTDEFANGIIGGTANIDIGSLVGLDWNIGVAVSDKYDFGGKNNIFAAAFYTGFDILDFKVQYGLKSYNQYDDEHFFYAGIDFNVVEHLVLDIYGGAYDLSHADESWCLGGNVGYEVSGVTFKLGLEYGAGASYAYDDNYWNDGEQSGKGLWIVPSISVKF